MFFKDRAAAGRELANQLTRYAGLENLLVLGIPRGGVPVAVEIAKALRAPLDIFLSRKLGVPGQEELAFGAVAAGNGRFLDERTIRATGITEEQVEQITRETRELLDQRSRLYRDNKPPLQVDGRIVILVDDGIATGASIYAAARALRQINPQKLIIAVPVAPLATYRWLSSQVDEIVALHTPADFYAVGQFYEHFSQLSDEEVILLLHQADDPVSHHHSDTQE